MLFDLDKTFKKPRNGILNEALITSTDQYVTSEFVCTNGNMSTVMFDFFILHSTQAVEKESQF